MDERRVTAFIGPSGCGKSTLLRCLNRMNDLIEDARLTGSVRISGRTSTRPQSAQDRVTKEVKDASYRAYRILSTGYLRRVWCSSS